MRDKKAFINLHSCLTDYSLIHIILLIKLIQYKIGKHDGDCYCVDDSFVLKNGNSSKIGAEPIFVIAIPIHTTEKNCSYPGNDNRNSRNRKRIAGVNGP